MSASPLNPVVDVELAGPRVIVSDLAYLSGSCIRSSTSESSWHRTDVAPDAGVDFERSQRLQRLLADGLVGRREHLCGFVGLSRVQGVGESDQRYCPHRRQEPCHTSPFAFPCE